MLSVNYSKSTTTYDPKGKVLQVSTNTYLSLIILKFRLNMLRKPLNKDRPLWV